MGGQSRVHGGTETFLLTNPLEGAKLRYFLAKEWYINRIKATRIRSFYWDEART